MKAYKNIKVEYLDSIAVLTLNNPGQLNKMTVGTLLEIKDAFEQLLNSPSKAVIITGSGKAFCAGGDISEMVKFDYKQARAYAKKGYKILTLIENFPKPVIAVLNGAVLGGGCELALACDIRIASDIVKIGQPEIKLGIICGWGATVRLPKIIGKSKAMKMIFSGEIIDAQEALKIGFVDRVVEGRILMDEAIKMAKDFAEKPQIALEQAKKAVLSGLGNVICNDKNSEAECFANCFKTYDQKEGMKAFLEKREPVFKGR